MTEELIVSNQIKCNKCGDTPFSKHRHDFVSCKCGAVSVDGGTDYLRRLGTEYTELSIVMPTSTIDKCLKSMAWADNTGRNERGKLYAILRILRDGGVELNGYDE